MLFKAVGSSAVLSRTALTIVSSTTSRPRVKRYKYSNVGTVTLDQNFEILLQRFTVAGTTTALTPAPVDPADPASSLFTAGSNATAEPTYTSNTVLDDTGVSPRGWYEFVANEQTDEIVLPATAANGVGFLVNVLGGATTVKVAATVLQ